MYTKPLSGMKFYRFKKTIMGIQESKAAGVRRNKAKMAMGNLKFPALPEVVI